MSDPSATPDPTQLPGDCYIPDAAPLCDACARLTHLAIVAHPDDAEFCGAWAIADCLRRIDADQAEPSFGVIVVTDGAGSAVGPAYAHLDAAGLVAVRAAEQRAAADAGRYSFAVTLGHTSTTARDPSRTACDADLDAWLAHLAPHTVITHDLLDRHATHVAVARRTIAALRRRAAAHRPDRLVGVEAWGSLDWLPSGDRLAFDLTGDEELVGRLARIFDSQLSGAKRYDAALLGRMQANATFNRIRSADDASAVLYGRDLTELLDDPARDPADWALAAIDRFRAERSDALRRWDTPGT